MTNTIKPTKIGKHDNSNVPLSSAEIGKLWITYTGNTMSRCVLDYYLNNVDDKDIRTILEQASKLTNYFLEGSKSLLQSVNHPIPVGFTKEDVNANAPRLFLDEFYLHYLRYTAKAGISIYSVAVPLMIRNDVREFFVDGVNNTMELINNINVMMLEKGFTRTPPVIPVPESVDFVNKKNYLSGFFGDIRPLHALEIAHLYDNIVNNMSSNALLIGFSQVCRNEKVKKFFVRGREITTSSLDLYTRLLNDDHLPALARIDHLVTPSQLSPFSDKLMVAHKIDMFSMKIRAFGNSIAVNGRRDVSVIYGRALIEIASYLQDGANIMIENGWMEQVPEALDRDKLTE
jgi:hypothetical protein